MRLIFKMKNKMKYIASEVILNDNNKLVTYSKYIDELYTIYTHNELISVYYAKHKFNDNEKYKLDFSIKDSQCREIENEEFLELIISNKLEEIPAAKVKAVLLKSLYKYITSKIDKSK